MTPDAPSPARALPRPHREPRDSGSASVLGVALIAAVVMVCALMLPLYIGLSVRQGVIAAADAAALAGADVASGRIPGYVCEAASEVAVANGAVLTGCAAEELVVTVSTERTFLGLDVVASATAGPATERRD